MLYPIKKMTFYDVSMNVPNNIPQFLRKVYGDNFMKPTGSKEHHGIHGNCRGDIDAIQSLHISRKWQPYEGRDISIFLFYILLIYFTD
jgi:hypothetical protein